MPPQSLFYAHALHSHPLKPAGQWHLTACVQHIVMGETEKAHLHSTAVLWQMSA